MIILACASLLAVIGDGLIFKMDTPTQQIRKDLSVKPPPYLPLIESPTSASNLRKEADEQMKAGYWEDEGNRFFFKPPYQWVGHPRSFAFQVNAWSPFTPYLLAFSHTGEKPYFDEVYQAALDWAQTQMPPALELKTTEEMDNFIGRREDFVWYDMGVGLRIHPLAWIFRSIASDPTYSDEEVKLFSDTLYFHMEALSRPKFFKAHNNHGLYQAVGQLAAARLVPEMPRMNDYAKLAQERLEELVARQFAPSGVHLEHSPAYHEMILRTFLAIRAAGLVDNEHLLQVIGQMEEALTWMIAPNFTIASLGDTQANRQSSTAAMQERYQNPRLKYQMSRGAFGSPPNTGVKAYPDAGYAFVRHLTKEGDYATASYLAQTAGFHSRTHKHADHLSFIWHENGKSILADPGRYGYVGRTETGSALHKAGFWYSDPNRMYVESTRAHNTVEIDGKDYPRVGVKPFGSALVGAEQQGELAVTECEVAVSATQKHRRLLVLKPGEFLLVVDQLDDTLPHDYTQWFNFAPDWQVTSKEGGYEATLEGMKKLQIRTLLPGSEAHPVARGQKEPRLQGWYSDTYNSVVPASSIAFEQKGAEAGRLITLFTFAEEVTIDLAKQQVSPDLTEATLSWNADGQRRQLWIEGGAGKPLQVKLEE